MRGTEVKEILTNAGLTQAAFARIVDRTPRRVSVWLRENRIPEIVEQQLLILKETNDITKLKKLENKFLSNQKILGTKQFKYDRAIAIYNNLKETGNMSRTARNFGLQWNQVRWAVDKLVKQFGYQKYEKP